MKLQIVCDDRRLMPTRAHAHDAGLDLRCALDFGVELDAGGRMLVDTGVAVKIPPGYVGLVHPRSGWAHKYGITVNNAPGTVDAGYTGTIKVNLINHGSETVALEYGDHRDLHSFPTRRSSDLATGRKDPMELYCRLILIVSATCTG